MCVCALKIYKCMQSSIDSTAQMQSTHVSYSGWDKQEQHCMRTAILCTASINGGRFMTPPVESRPPAATDLSWLGMSMMCVGSTNTRKTQLSNRRHARVACMVGVDGVGTLALKTLPIVEMWCSGSRTRVE